MAEVSLEHSPSDHPREELFDIVSGALRSPRRDQVMAHVDECSECQKELRDAQEMDGLLDRELEAELSFEQAREVAPSWMSEVRDSALDSPKPALQKLPPLWWSGGMVAAVLVLAWILVGRERQGGVTDKPSVAVLSAEEVRARLASLRKDHREFFEEVSRGTPTVSRWFAVPSQRYPDLATALPLLGPKDRLLITPAFEERNPREGQWRDTDGDGTTDMLHVQNGSSIPVAVLGRSVEPFAKVRASFLADQQFAAAEKSEAASESLRRVVLSLEHSRRLFVRGLVVSPDGQVEPVEPSPFDDWWAIEAEEVTFPPSQPLLEFLDDGAIVSRSDLSRIESLGCPGPLFLANRSQLFFANPQGLLESKLVDVISAPPLLVPEDSLLVILLSEDRPVRVPDRLSVSPGSGAPFREAVDRELQAWVGSQSGLRGLVIDVAKADDD